MRIQIGARTEEAMQHLGIGEYPFSPEELSNKFRAMIKSCHPDTAGNIALEEKAKGVIIAYKHLKNLAISFGIGKEQKEQAMKSFEENEDMFTFWEPCSECGGSGKTEIFDPYGLHFAKCDECDLGPEIKGFWGAFLGKQRSSGKKTLGCRVCKGTGKFKQRNGRVVDCYKCKGTGIFKVVTCRKCDGTGRITRTGFKDCYKCKGLGKVKLDLFNPVIRKGSILFK